MLSVDSTEQTGVLFRFVKQAAPLTQKRCAASPTAVVCDPVGNGLADWKHLTLHFLRIHMDATYREIVDCASEMDRVRGLLQLAWTAFPAPSTLWRSFERVPLVSGDNCCVGQRPAAIPASMSRWMPPFSTVKRHPATTKTGRIGIYGR